MTSKFLDNNGLSYFWGKIKDWADGRFLKLSGGTLTGSLNGTSASFSGNVKADHIIFSNNTDLYDNANSVTHLKTSANSSNKQADFTFEPDGKFYHRISTNSGSSWTDWYCVGETVEQDVSTAVSVATSTYKSIASVALTPGIWVISYGVQYASNSSGVRDAYLNTSQNANANNALYRQTLAQGPAASGSATYMRGSCIMSPTSNTTYYLTAWQNSGSSLNCYGHIKAVRIW